MELTYVFPLAVCPYAKTVPRYSIIVGTSEVMSVKN